MEVENVKLWTEAQEQLEHLSMRRLYGVGKDAWLQEGLLQRARDIVRWLQSRSTNLEEPRKNGDPSGGHQSKEARLAHGSE